MEKYEHSIPKSRTMATDINNSSTSTTLSYNDTFALLRLLDDENARNAAIVFVYLALLVASGLPGNLLVIVVYATKFKVTTTRTFILTLAALDLLNCIFGIPEEMIDLYRRYTYPSLAMCKVDALFTSFTSISSGNVLVALAVDRYRKVCRPLSTQLTPGGATVAVLGCCLLTVVLAWPFPVLYGFHLETSRIPGVAGTGCDISDTFTDTKYPLAFDLVLFMVFLTCVVTLIVLYALVFKQIRARFHSRHSGQEVAAFQSATSTSGAWGLPMESCDEHRDVSQHCSEHASPGEATADCHDGSPETQRSTDVEANRTDEVASTQDTGDISKQHRDMEATAPRSADEDLHSKRVQTKRRSSTDQRGRRPSYAEVRVVRNTTLTLFLVTLVYVLSFLPYLVIMGLRGVKLELFQGMSPSSQAAYELFIRSIHVQNAANPLIYGFLNSQFRRKCREVLRCRQRG